jgi:hypothetical protein
MNIQDGIPIIEVFKPFLGYSNEITEHLTNDSDWQVVLFKQAKFRDKWLSAICVSHKYNNNLCVKSYFSYIEPYESFLDIDFHPYVDDAKSQWRKQNDLENITV